jgi:hypothetical protein
MNEYTSNQYQDNYAVESKRNILETPFGRKSIGKLEAKYEALLRETDEDFPDD